MISLTSPFSRENNEELWHPTQSAVTVYHNKSVAKLVLERV